MPCSASSLMATPATKPAPAALKAPRRIHLAPCFSSCAPRRVSFAATWRTTRVQVSSARTCPSPWRFAIVAVAAACVPASCFPSSRQLVVVVGDRTSTPRRPASLRLASSVRCIRVPLSHVVFRFVPSWFRVRTACRNLRATCATAFRARAIAAMAMRRRKEHDVWLNVSTCHALVIHGTWCTW